MRGSAVITRSSPNRRRVIGLERRATGEGLHVAAIMDGNGRWATTRRLDRIAGHAAGEAAVEAIVDAAIEERVSWLTLFAFSTENWNRPHAEVEFLMEFNRQLIVKHGPSYHARNVRVRYLGEDDRVPKQVLEQGARWKR